MSEAYKVISEIEKNHITQLTKKNLRIDGRDFNEFRSIEIETDLITKAEGSAYVKLGNTHIIAGVKAITGEPYPDIPNEGVITVNAELIPLASPHFESGPPGEESIEVARVVDRGIRHSEIVDRTKLCIIPGKQVWIIFVDLYVLSYDGNMFDCGELAAVSALLTTKIPNIEIKDDKIIAVGDKYNKDNWNYLPIQNLPTSITIGKIANKLFIDPNENEERVLDARITLTIDEKNNIVSMQKGAEGYFTPEEIQQAVHMVLEKSDTIRKLYPPKPVSNL
ncbi:MAG: exosome complex protein Rrp42 [Candidatus Lokiarchaeota archaeon]|nr:exosome complex protein Rrp42 [Candidatus Lokiarchaeota archaeon]